MTLKELIEEIKNLNSEEQHRLQGKLFMCV